MSVFTSFDVLLPQPEHMDKWPVVACDQFTSQPEYWQELKEHIADAPSALNCILPEVELKGCTEERYGKIRESMDQYLGSGLFRTYKSSFIYVERTLINGSIRAGIVGVIDLEEYDFHSDSCAAIRATERTVEERIPPRMKVRRGASMELSHVLMLCDDEQKNIIEPLRDIRDSLEKVYELELLLGGGHICAWLIDGENAKMLQQRIDDYCAGKSREFEGKAPMLFAVGDGNHSLATAKECYEELKRSTQAPDVLARARYAMVELENIRADAEDFEPIHRLITDVDVNGLLSFLKDRCGADDGYPIDYVAGDERGTIYLDKTRGLLPVGILQPVLDEYLGSNSGSIDYIHGIEALTELSHREKAIGFALPPVAKGDFFRGIARDGVLPRKTFSMGEAQEKRYYIEARAL